MHEIKRPYKSMFNVSAYFPGNAGLTVSYTLQDLTTSSVNYLKFWNSVAGTWATGIVANACPAIVSNPGLYVAIVNHALLTGFASDDSYAVVVNETTNSYHDFFILRFGDAAEQASANVAAFIVPKRREISRVTDTHVRIQSYDATTAGTMILQVDSTQNTSGTQPEETQTLTSP